MNIMPKKPLSLYIHYPYCIKKCPYCDFNSHVVKNHQDDEYAIAIKTELAYYAQLTTDYKITTIFFGGGTPSLMECGVCAEILDFIAKKWQLSPEIEITLEANSGATDIAKIAQFAQSGINRLSLGVQALEDASLKKLGRIHDAKTAIKAIEAVSKNYKFWSFDLIYARPWQSINQWLKECQFALSFAPEHLSLYQLTIEQGTDFHRLARLGKLKCPTSHKAARMFVQTRELLQANGLMAYEISNHAKIGHESRHNLNYWQCGDWLGIGAGAHSRLNLQGKRTAIENHRLPQKWHESVAKIGHSTAKQEIISDVDYYQELLMMGLRMESGIKLPKILSAQIAQKYQDLCEYGYAIDSLPHARLTLQGTMRLNAILDYLLN